MAEGIKRYNQPVRIKVGDMDSLYWNPDAPETSRLTGNPELVNLITSYVDYKSGGSDTLKATPEGPYLPGTIDNLYTVVWAVTDIFGAVGEDVKFYGEVPSLKDLDLDYASNFDENGNQIIR
jgi:hypothetical protein